MISRWLIGAMMFGLLYAVLRVAGREPEIAVLAIVVMLCLAWTRKEPISVTIAADRKTLTYCYRNGLGQRKRIRVSLNSAAGSYEYKDYNNISCGWRLLLYNGHYFKNRISIMENEKSGFSKKQLDQIVTIVHQCRSDA